MGQHETADFHRHTIGADSVKEISGIWAVYVIFCKPGQVHHTDTFTHRHALITYHFKYIVAPETVLLFTAIG